MIVDKVVPKEHWEFDTDVTACFDNMLSRSIPGYDLMRTLVTNIQSNRHQNLTEHRGEKSPFSLLDLGSSRGESFSCFIEGEDAPKNVEVRAIEASYPMCTIMRERYAGNKNVRIIEDDLRNADYGKNADVATSILTLQFVPLEDRASVFQKVFRALAPSGCFILVEKVHSQSGVVDELLTELYYSFKKSKGYTEQDIAAKRASLSGVMSTLDSKWNESMLYAAGFDYVEPFFRAYNFAGWIAIVNRKEFTPCR